MKMQFYYLDTKVIFKLSSSIFDSGQGMSENVLYSM